MRRAFFAIAFTLAVVACAPRAFGQVDARESGAVQPAPAAASESLPLRLGKALAFAVVVSGLLLAGGMWRRGRRKTRSQKGS